MAFKSWRSMTPDELRGSYRKTQLWLRGAASHHSEEVFTDAICWIKRIAAERGINLEE